MLPITVSTIGGHFNKVTLEEIRALKHQLSAWFLNDFLEVPVWVLRSATTAKTLIAAETPISIFASLPIVLANDISDIFLAYEKSYDTGQVIWNQTGDDINHQWGKASTL